MTDFNCEHHIAVIAYYKWESAGRPEGRDEEFWLDACEEYKTLIQTQGTNGPFTSLGE